MLTRGGNRYFLTFINDCSRFTYVFLLKNKSETFNAFKVYKVGVENQLSKNIKVLRRIEVVNISLVNSIHFVKNMA